jgi:hypothetical protein
MSGLEISGKNREIYQLKVNHIDQIPVVRQLASECGAGVSHSKNIRVTFDMGTIEGRMDKDKFFAKLPKGILVDRLR